MEDLLALQSIVSVKDTGKEPNKTEEDGLPIPFFLKGPQVIPPGSEGLAEIPLTLRITEGILPLTPLSRPVSWGERLNKNMALSQHSQLLIDAGLTEEMIRETSEKDLQDTLVEAIKWSPITSKMIAKKLKLMLDETN